MVLPENKFWELLVEASNNFNGEHFHYLGNPIPASSLSNARHIHDIGINEEILLLIDRGAFINNGKLSTLFLEDKLSISIDEGFSEFSNFSLEWESFFDVKRIDDKIVFYLDKDDIENNIPVYQGHIVPQDTLMEENINSFIKFVKKLIVKIKKNENERKLQLDKFIKQFDNVYQKQNYNEALDIANSVIDSYDDYFVGYFYKAILLNELGKYNDGLNFVNDTITRFGFKENEEVSNNEIYSNFLTIKSEILYNLNKYYDAAFSFANSNKIYSQQDKFLYHDSDVYYQKFIQDFFEIEFNNRKIILISKDFPLDQPESFLIILKNKIPEIKFPLGHPYEDELYFAHPFKKDIYYHSSNYENMLMQEKLMELNDILECLGAKNIVTKTSGVFDMQNKQDTTGNINAEAGFIKSLKGEASIDFRERENSLSNNSASSEQSFSYNKEPYLPENLLWFNHEPTWQKLSEQRLKGNIIKSKIKLSSKISEFISSSEKIKALTEFKAIILKMEASMQLQIESENKKMTDEEWEIEVEFYPINKNTNQININNSEEKELLNENNLNEKEYIELLKDCIEDGKISDDERKILERYQKKYNISDQRVKQIESEIFNVKNLTENETVYFEEVKFCLQEDNIISNDERRILERLRIKLKIDEEKANEIENSLLKK